jgi:hypothetical protein
MDFSLCSHVVAFGGYVSTLIIKKCGIIINIIIVARLCLQAVARLSTSIENYQETHTIVKKHTQLSRNTQLSRSTHNYQETQLCRNAHNYVETSTIIKKHTQLSRNTQNYQETHTVM